MLTVAQSTTIGQSGNFPASIPGCILWLTPESFYFEGTTLVGHDKSGCGNNCFQTTAANQPAFNPAAGGLPSYMSFDGGDELVGNFIHPIRSGMTFPTEPPQFSYFILRRSTVAAQSGTLFSTSNAAGATSANFFDVFQFNNSHFLRYLVAGDASYANSSILDEVDSGTAGNISRKSYLNGVLKASSTAAVNSNIGSITQYKVGGYFTLSLFWQGRIYEIVIYNRMLSDIERTTVERYLLTKIGL
jgi:hypothetical protein